MPEPTEAYRAGYEKGKKDSLGGRMAEVTMGVMRDDPGGYFAAGYSDAAAGRKFQLPAPKQRSPPVSTTVSISDEERAWFQLCDRSEFISLSVAKEYHERLLAAHANPTVYMIGLHPFYELSCPKCGEAGYL